MKFMIASDIHGSVYYTKKLLEAYRREGASRLVLLGDLLYHGPRNDLPRDYLPIEVAALLNSVKSEILAVHGNCDSEVDEMVLEFPIGAQYAILTAGGRTVFVTHGHIFNTENVPPLKNGDILLHGHTHVQVCEDMGGYIYMNPGSVSIPKESSRHGYMTLEDNLFIWKDIDGEELMRFEA